jgi:hypothetical protein
VESSIEILQNIKNRINIWPSNTNSGYIPKGSEIGILEQYLHFMFSTALVKIVKVRIQLSNN